MRIIKIISTFFKIISVILILLIITLLLIPNLLGIKPHIDYLGTMNPTIKKGSISYINENIKYESIKKDDIIGVNIRNQQVTSRVLKVNEDKMLETKGDKESNEEIIIISKKEYLGRVVLTIPYAGSIITLFQNHFILTSVIILTIIVVITLDFILDKNKDNIDINQEIKEKLNNSEDNNETEEIEEFKVVESDIEKETNKEKEIKSIYEDIDII